MCTKLVRILKGLNKCSLFEGLRLTWRGGF